MIGHWSDGRIRKYLNRIWSQSGIPELIFSKVSQAHRCIQFRKTFSILWKHSARRYDTFKNLTSIWEVVVSTCNCERNIDPFFAANSHFNKVRINFLCHVPSVICKNCFGKVRSITIKYYYSKLDCFVYQRVGRKTSTFFTSLDIIHGEFYEMICPHHS